MSNFRQVGGVRKYLGWNKWNKGEYVVGTYEELYEDNYGKNGYAILIEESNIEGFEKGDLFGANSSGSLNFKMEKVLIGQKIKLAYEGMEPTTNEKYAKTNPNQHIIEVYIDDEYGAKVQETEIDVESSLTDEEIL